MKRFGFIFYYFLALSVIPIFDLTLNTHISDTLRPILILSVLGLGLNIVVGFTGLLNLGVAAFMAIGAFTYSILTCDIYPFQFPFLAALIFTMTVSTISGIILGLPTIRLKGDYLAIVTLGFGEIVQDSLRNLEVITKGTQGINPIPSPSILGISLTPESSIGWYYFFFIILLLSVVLTRSLERSRIGRSLIAIREDELAARCMGVKATNLKLISFACGACLSGLAGALWALQLGSSGEPGNYDFQVSILALCIVIVGGLGSIRGVLLGALVMVGFNSIILTGISQYLSSIGFESTDNVLLSPNNWKYAVFGLALILMMRYRPEGILPSKYIKEELHHSKEGA